MKVVSLINMKGGVAKTTLAINLADCLSQRHHAKVLLIDVDPQFNATQCLMKPELYMQHLSEGGDTIVNIFDRNPRPIASSVGGTGVTSPKSLEDIKLVNVGNFDLLPGNLDLYRLEMAPGEGRENRLKAYVEKISAEYDYVVIDTPPTPSVWMTSALIASNYYLIPVKPDPISLTGIDLLRSIISEKKENFNLNIECAGVVLTIVEENTLVFRNGKRHLSADAYWNSYLYKQPLIKRTAVANKQLDQLHILASDDAELKKNLTGIVTEFTNRVQTDE